MGFLTNVEDISQALDGIETIGSMCDLIDNRIKTSDYNLVGYHCIPPIGAAPSDPVSLVTFSKFSREEISDYRQKETYRSNPIITRPILMAQPLLWSQLLDLPNLTRKDKCFIKLFRKRFPGEGLSVPVFGPLGHNGNVCVQIHKDKHSLSSADILKVQMLCQKAHIMVCNSLNKLNIHTISLSQRERDILDLIVVGKSNCSIADTLGLSLHVVNGYIKRLFLKLGTSDRVSTALRAIALGIGH
jgi:LuxR family transcriptional regulator/LuxR family quorum-sensing system transcriptional regulator CciR